MQKLALDECYDMECEIAVLHEWEAIQRDICTFTLTTLPSVSLSRQATIDEFIKHCTRGRAGIHWESVALRDVRTCDRLCEIRCQNRHYGFLGLSPGYLASHVFPTIPQTFASLCAVLLSFAEYQALIEYQLGNLPSLFLREQINGLTRRERDVLLGIVRGKSDAEMAEALGIEPTTVHTHRKRLYQRLGVHCAQEAALRSFTHQLVNWLDEPQHIMRSTGALSPFEGRNTR